MSSSESVDESTPSCNIKFMSPDDKVVSEVNPFLVQVTKHNNVVNPLQKPSNLVATIIFNVPAAEKRFLQDCTDDSTEHRPEDNTRVDNTHNHELLKDEDGDLILLRNAEERNDKELNILIEYENSTSLDLVGLQIWRGAFLLSDFVIHNASKFQGKNVLEVGSGTGLVGIVASLFAKNVVLTDLNEPSIMNLLKANIAHNKDLIGQGKTPSILPLDFMAETWSQELTHVVSSSDVVVVADVIYHVEITNAFIRTLRKILTAGEKRSKDIYVALEKRYVFTLADMDSCAPMHNHFLEQLDTQLGLSPGCLPRPLDLENTIEVTMTCVPLDFKQYFNYDRCKELVLYHIRSQFVSKM
ncbi:methyltransferase-like protein 22 [Folsomia candida]|uniref:methyltransferase-like protein 22 n=1 Tax=Folsomia candida TaxID=158441 RepID=UPI000B8FE6A0|nr:methyltransferase-like protein 22 [Folsomia candida]